MTDLLPHISQPIVNLDDTASYEMRGWMEVVDQLLTELSEVRDFYTEVAKGNVEGHSVRGLVFRNANTGSTFEDIWGGVGDLVYPTAAETWEIVSDNVNDATGGTGANAVLVNYLDDSFVQQSVLVNLNGTTPVTLNSNHFRPDGAVVVVSGSSRSNEGTITIQAVGGGNPRQVIAPGFSSSEDCHFTVPAGKTAYALNVTPFYPKNEDGAVAGSVTPFGTNTEITTGEFPFYQDTFAIVFRALFPLSEMADVKFKARSTNPGAVVNMVFEVLLVDNP